MERIKLPGSDLEVSRMCLGTMNLVTPELAETVISVFAQAGGNFLDTAHCYSFWTPHGAGASERSVAAAVRRLGLAGTMVIATKGGHPTEPGYRTVDRYLDAGRVAADIDDSLGRLGADCIDLYWLHRDDLRVAAGEIVEMLNGEIRRGRIRFPGASNWSTARIEEANAYAAAHGLRGFVASQPEYSLAVPPEETRTQRFLFRAEEIAWHAKTRFPVIPYSPSAKGYFATGGSSGGRYDNPGSGERLGRVKSLAARLGVPAGRLALAWLLNQPFPVIPIVGSTNTDHVRDALLAPAVALSQADVLWLERGDAAGPRRR